MALGSSCFGLLFLGSGSMLGSTLRRCPRYDSVSSSGLVLWVANPKDIVGTHHNTCLTKRMNHRGPRVFGLPVVALRVIIRPRPTLGHSGPKNGVARSGNNLPTSLPEAPEHTMVGFRRRGRVSRDFSLAGVAGCGQFYAGPNRLWHPNLGRLR
jgi:hypothetical protein